MLLTETQKNGLTEFTKMALARRTAASLSELIGFPVVVQVSNVSLQPLSGLVPEFSELLPNQVATIHQLFTGSITGDALLLVDYYYALMLSNVFRHDSDILPHRLDASACEILTEVGNIVLNAYLGMLSKMLQRQLSFSIPCFDIEELVSLTDSLTIGKNEFRYALVVETLLQFHDKSVPTHLVFVSGVVSISCLIKAIETWASLSVSCS
ncbi:chemotaxis protein CheC [Laspinema sp. A4]|uniref:chemotaxis protein CheC n=1 Tax=Laspinema sp. D2d TaxID=2953686 RepID=UPI0021BB2F04|nr:chemotaxis protein CheC [Laspinema sp. D2d]MCT7985099.1 chemotaxis protein CheC [Laspinema sp. D2d]